MDSEGIENLFFSLSSKSRLDILQSISADNLRMNEIARKNDITATEASRQIQRLLDEQVIQKQPDGAYTLTSYGKLFLHFFPSLEFIFKHKHYFFSHDIWQLPPKFISRLGELNGGVLCLEIAEVINHIEEMMQAAEEYVWVLTNQAMTSHTNVMLERVSKGVKFRSLIPEKMINSSQVRVIGKTVETRTVASIPALVVISEKEAFLALLSTDGKIVHSGFFGCDHQFMGWVNDFYLYNWQQSQPRYTKQL